nr:hypothetical protein [Tanacetum cinerariifolium]
GLNWSIHRTNYLTLGVVLMDSESRSRQVEIDVSILLTSAFTPIVSSELVDTPTNEPASPVRDVSEGEACPTASGFIADQDRATIAKEGVASKQSGEDAPIKGRSNNEGEAAAERISNDSEEIARVLTSMDAATVLAGEIDVPTGSGFIPSAGPPATVISTGSEVEDFIPMGSKEESERLKRKGLNLEKEQVKKQKSSEEAPEIETTTKEFTEEKIKEIMQLVPVEEVYVQALQVKHPIIDWKVHSKEDREAVATKQSREDAPIKGRSNNEGEVAAERISNDSEEIARVLTFMDAATVLAGETNVPTAGPPATLISTGSKVGPTASLIVRRRKGKEVMVESNTPKKKKLQEQIDAQVARELEEQQKREDMRMNEQIARDAEVARIHAEEEIQGMIDSLDKSNETIAKYLQEYQQFALELPLEKKIELISNLVKYQEHYTKVHKFQ